MTDQDRLAEISRRLARTEDHTQNMLTRTAVLETRTDAMSTDITEIRDNTKWIVRLIIGAIAMAIVAFMIRGGLSAV